MLIFPQKEWIPLHLIRYSQQMNNSVTFTVMYFFLIHKGTCTFLPFCIWHVLSNMLHIYLQIAQRLPMAR